MGGFARGTVAIVNLSDREHSFHLNEMELPVQMAGSEASTTSTSIDLEQPNVSLVMSRLVGIRPLFEVGGFPTFYLSGDAPSGFAHA